MDNQKDSGVSYSTVYVFSQMLIAVAAMDTGGVLGSRSEEKSCHQPMCLSCDMLVTRQL